MSKCDVKRGQEFYSMWLLGGLGHAPPGKFGILML